MLRCSSSVCRRLCSATSRRCSSALFTLFLSASRLSRGFVMKSKAPSWSARTAVSSVAWPVSTIQDAPGVCSLAHCMRLMPSSSGIAMSVMTTSKRRFLRHSFASAAVEAVSITRVPSLRSVVASSRQMASLSSTMRIEEVSTSASLEGSKGGPPPEWPTKRAGNERSIRVYHSVWPRSAIQGFPRGATHSPPGAASLAGPGSGVRGIRFGSKSSSDIIRAVSALARAER